MEKRHHNQGTISQLKINDTDFVTSDEKILSECESFYRNLYSSKINMPNYHDTPFFEQDNDTVLSKDEQSLCEGLLTEKECLEALKAMESEKTPGTDGLPAEFYKVFWIDIKTPLIRALNFSHETGQLSITQRRGIIKLIPKKDAEPHFIKNWRPLRF